MNPRVLITRDPQRAAGLIEKLKNHSIAGICIPVTKTVFIEEAAPDLSSYTWISFTSATAVAAFATLMKKSEREIPASIEFAVVGMATANAATRYGMKPHLISSQPNASGLAVELIRSVQGRSSTKVLWPCAEEHTPAFEKVLKEAGIAVQPWVCYRTIPVAPDKLHEELNPIMPVGAAVFFAPSAVKSFLDAWPMPWSFPAIAIGRTTSRALNEACVINPVVSRGTTEADILSAVLSAVDRRTETTPIMPGG